MEQLDEATAALILQLQLEDSNSLSDELVGKGKGPEGVLSDSQVALQLYREELERSSSLLADRVMTKSIARACITDGQILSASQSQEQTAASDREAACRLGGQTAPPVIPPWTVTPEFLDDDLIAKLAALYLPITNDFDAHEAGPAGFDFDAQSEAGESSAWAGTRPNARSSSTRKCTACLEQVVFYDTARVPCGDEYCRECLQALFTASMVDDSLFPPRCCRQIIKTGGVRMFLTSDIVKQYEAKKIEFETLDRTYCSNPLCSVFLTAANIQGELATCPDCATLTCTMCKAGSHSGDCPADTGLQLVLQTAQENGWMRCYNCRRLVELDHGCNHMTCTCRAQFCYLCGLAWKTCRCEQWNEDRLLTRAQQVVARRPAAPQQRLQQVAAVVENLRTRHNCDHESWQYVRGSHQCEECYHTLPSYIFECRQCNIQACNRCRKNRL